MKIASSLLNWLTRATTAQEVNLPNTQVQPEKVVSPGTTSAPADKVQFSELAQKLSQTPPAEIEAHITLEERLALRQEPQTQTYKPSLMQMAKKFLGMGMT
ncbi:hypothetical protein L9S41_03915 [Geoalkalibacter halelectricus]|uniref:Flagellar hook-length control protein FliK n=2 Tax=Geoalkalibacter halelectricus TaxID=2847045 RepID=A0ABY5ZN11_9BACT|nr:hypothetical protein [Geoalkalibacter halelectricus]UWZ80552.1 hypothetical protein L9S41_03915 [Geoalkalibacter halelectricus]